MYDKLKAIFFYRVRQLALLDYTTIICRSIVQGMSGVFLFWVVLLGQLIYQLLRNVHMSYIV